METSAVWLFDPVPASGSRSGGDPSAFVFDVTLDAFVREVLQNSADQRVDERPVEVRFVLDEIRGERRRRFEDTLRFGDLREHLDGVRRSAGPTERRRFEHALEGARDRLLVLWIEDRNTTGLDGDESGKGRFAALCRDRLFSEKLASTAGGSFGLGKAVLWRFSRWSTVAFFSRLTDGRARFIAKAALPWHQVAGEEFAGDGWLGKADESGRSRAVSLWGDAAVEAIEGLGSAAHPPGVTGTAIGVVGFEEPASEDLSRLADLAERLHAAAERTWWPAIERRRLEVSVHVDGFEIPAGGDGPWVRLYRDYLAGVAAPALVEIGDVVVKALRIELPRKRDGGTSGQTLVADLVVRLAAPSDPEVNVLQAFRGTGMVVTRQTFERLGLGTRPFQALLVCGTARRDPAEDDGAAEEFLRAAEPPSHDRWTSTPRLREEWTRGYAKALDALASETRHHLRRLVAPATSGGDEGPNALRKLFPLGSVGDAGRPESPFVFRDLRASLQPDGRWVFEGVVAPAEPLDRGWVVRIDARVPEDEGRGTGGLVGELETREGAVTLQEGVAIVRAEAGTQEVRFRGRTEPGRFPIAPQRTKLELVVTSEDGLS